MYLDLVWHVCDGWKKVKGPKQHNPLKRKASHGGRRAWNKTISHSHGTHSQNTSVSVAKLIAVLMNFTRRTIWWARDLLRFHTRMATWFSCVDGHVILPAVVWTVSFPVDWLLILPRDARPTVR